METACKVSSFVLALFFLELCNALPINLENSGPDSHTQFLTGLVAVLLTVCSVVLLVGCLCCQRRNGFKEFRDSPVAASVANSLDHGHVNPIANSEFTIFTPISPPHHNNNVFLANQRIVSRTQDDYKYGDIDVTYWFDGSEEDFPRKKLKYIRELGKGWFGRVVEGTAQGLSKNPEEWCPVAVRILEASASSRERVLFLYDATVYRCGSHSNILKVLGRSLDTIPLLLLQEFCTEGDLKRYLRNNKSTCEKFLSTEYPLLWCYQVTSAVKFLHGCKVTHPDLAARNCQLTTDLQLKLGDYGLSATLYPEDYYEGAPAVPLRWCAPETISYTSTTIQLKQITFEGNVWSLGVTLWEICECGDQPYSWLTDDEVVAQVIETSKVRLPRPCYSTIYTDYLYRLMQSCWSTFESRSSIYQIELMLADLMQVYEHTKVITYGEAVSVPMHDFDKRWESLKPNKTDNDVDCYSEQDLRSLNALNLHVSNADEVLNDKRLSASMNNLHGSLDNLLEYKNSFDPMESWLENVACNTGDMSYVKGLSEAIKDLDNAIALENVSSDSSHHQSPIPDVIPRQNKLHFKLGQVFKPSFSELAQNDQRTSSESETEDEAWRKKIERGAYSEKVRQKSRSVTDLMVLTHIDCSESDSETTMPSIDYKINHRNMRYIKNMENSNLKFGSEGNLLSVQDTFQEELRKLQEERRDSLLFVPDNRSRSSSSIGDVLKVNRDLPNVVANTMQSSPVKKLFEELNNPVDIVPAKQVYNVFNVSVDQKYSSLCSVQNRSALEPKTTYQINKIKTIDCNNASNNISDNNCLITPKREFVVRENTNDNKRVLNDGVITKVSSNVPGININSDNNRMNTNVDVCNICSVVNSDVSFPNETRISEKENSLENLISFADTDRNYNRIKQLSLRNQRDIIKTWLSEDIFSINEEELPLRNNKIENEQELIKRENSHNLKKDCANFLSSQLHSVGSFDYEIKHQVPKLVDIIQNNIKLLDYIIVNDKDKLDKVFPKYCEVKKSKENCISEPKNFKNSFSIEDNEHIQYHTSEVDIHETSFLNFNNNQNKDEYKIFNNKNYDASKEHENKVIVLENERNDSFKKKFVGQVPEVKLEDIKLIEVTSEETLLNDLNHTFVPIVNSSYTNVQELQTDQLQPGKQNLNDSFLTSKEDDGKIIINNSKLIQLKPIEQCLSNSAGHKIGIQAVNYDLKVSDMVKVEETTTEKTFDLDHEFVQFSNSAINIQETEGIKKIEGVLLNVQFDKTVLNNLNASQTDVNKETWSKNEVDLNSHLASPEKSISQKTAVSEIQSLKATDQILPSDKLESKKYHSVQSPCVSEANHFNNIPENVVNVEESKVNTSVQSYCLAEVTEVLENVEEQADLNEINSNFVDSKTDVSQKLNEMKSENICEETSSISRAQQLENFEVNRIDDEYLIKYNEEFFITRTLYESGSEIMKNDVQSTILPNEGLNELNHPVREAQFNTNESSNEVEVKLISEPTETNHEHQGEEEKVDLSHFSENIKIRKCLEESTPLVKKQKCENVTELNFLKLSELQEKFYEEKKTVALNEGSIQIQIEIAPLDVKISKDNSHLFENEAISSNTEEEKINVLQLETTKSEMENEKDINEMVAVNVIEPEEDSNLFNKELLLSSVDGEKLRQEETIKTEIENKQNTNKIVKANEQMIIFNVEEIEDNSTLFNDELILNTNKKQNAKGVKADNANKMLIVPVQIGNITNDVEEIKDNSNLFNDKLILNKEEKINVLSQEISKSRTKEGENARKMVKVNELKTSDTAVDVKEIVDNSNFSADELISNTIQKENMDILQEEATKTKTEKEENTNKIANVTDNVNESEINSIHYELNLNAIEEEKLDVLQQETPKITTEKRENTNKMAKTYDKLKILSTIGDVKEIESNFFGDDLILNIIQEENLDILQREAIKAKTEKEENINEMTELTERVHIANITDDMKEIEDSSIFLNIELNSNADEEEKLNALQQETPKIRTDEEENANNIAKLNEQMKYSSIALEVNEAKDNSNLFHDEPILIIAEEENLTVLQKETTKPRAEKEENINEMVKLSKPLKISNTIVKMCKVENNSNLFDGELILNNTEEENLSKLQNEPTKTRIENEGNTNAEAELSGQMNISNVKVDASEIEDNSNLFNDELLLNTAEEKNTSILQKKMIKYRTEKEENTNEMAHLNKQVQEIKSNSNLSSDEETPKTNEEEKLNIVREEIIKTKSRKQDDILTREETQSETTEEEKANIHCIAEYNTKSHLENQNDAISLTQVLLDFEKVADEEVKLNILQEATETRLEKEMKILNTEDLVQLETTTETTLKNQLEEQNDAVSLTQVFLDIEKGVSSIQSGQNQHCSANIEGPDEVLISSDDTKTIFLLDKDTELERLNSEISLNKTKGLDTSSEKIIDKLTQIIKAEKQKQIEPVSELQSSRIQTCNFLNHEVQHYIDAGQQSKLKIQFDLSENQQEIAPNSLTHYSAFTGASGMKRSLDSMVILGASDDYSIDYYSGLKTSLEEAGELQFSSNFVQDGTQKPFRFRSPDLQDHSDLKYSLETWDNFLDKTFDDQNSRSTDFSNFSEEPQSLLFLEAENYDVKAKGITKNDYNCKPLPKNIEQVPENTDNLTFNLDVSEAVKNEDKHSQKGSDSDGSWEAGEGWFLHPQSSSEEPIGQIASCQAGTSESYVGFSMDDEIMTALRNELLSKLPHAQRASNDQVEDHEELDTSEKNEVFVRYNVYSTPLSPIPEETFVDSDESRCASPQRYDSSDDNSDWSMQDNNSPYNRTETQSPKLTESPAKEPLNRHTPSQDSCCSNDTLFNLEELNIANDHEKLADVTVKIETEVQSHEKTDSDSPDDQTAHSQNSTDIPTVNNEETIIPSCDAKIINMQNETSTTFNVPKINVHNYIQEFLNNERYTQLNSSFKLDENKSENEDASTNSDVYLSVSDNTFAFGQNVAPLNSPEDKPWKELQASFRQCEEDEMIEDKDILEALDESDQSNDGNELGNHEMAESEFLESEVIANKVLPESEGFDNMAEYVSLEDLKNKMNLSVLETKAESDDLDSSSDMDDARPKVLGSSSDSYDDLYGPLTDIRFSGPANVELMTTSFNESNDLMEEQDWDSGSDTRSSSSGEFIWREGEHEASVKALRAAPQSENLNNVAPMEHIQEECETSSCTSDSEAEECPEFVPSAWDMYATPTKSALRSPEKSLERAGEKGKKSKAVWFKKQKYHCVYEYPREPESPLLQSYDLWQPAPDYSTIADWDLDGNSYLPALDELDCAQDCEVKNDKCPKNLYHLTTFPDLTMGTTMLDEDFFISSSSRPFDMLGGLTSQFFPGKQFLDNWNENATPDSGVEDIIPVASLSDDTTEIQLPLQVQSLKSLAAAVAKQNESRNTALGGLRHTRNKLKLDLPPSPSAFTSSRSFTVEPVEEILNRQAPTFTTFGKSRFLVQQVDTSLDDKQSKNVSFEAIPYKPAKQFYKNDFDREKHKVESVKGEASLLDSADEDSGIESCTLERKKGVDV